MQKKIICLLSIMTAMAAVMGAASAIAIDYFAIVTGTVYDSDSSLPVAGVSVTVECDDLAYAGSTVYDVTDSNGEYGVWIVCPPDTDVIVTATDGEHESSSTGTLETIGMYTGADGVDVVLSGKEIDVSIPEFPIALLPAMMSVLGVAFARKS